AGHAQRVRASRGPDAAREEQEDELTRATALRESRPCTKRRNLTAPRDVRRDAQAGAPSTVPLRRRADSDTAARRWTSRRAMSTKNMISDSYIRYLKTLLSHADAIDRSIGGLRAP